MPFNVTTFETIYAASGEQTAINTIEELSKLLHLKIVSPSIFKDNKRKNKNFLSTDLLVLDIDGGIKKEAVLEAFKNYKLLVTFTKSHRKLKNGVIAERMRVVLFLSHPITDELTYRATWKAAQKIIPEIDPQCCDPARIFFPSVVDEFDKPIIQEGELFQIQNEPVKTENNSEHVVHVEKAAFVDMLNFLVGKDADVKKFVDDCHTGLQGSFNRLLNKTAFLMAAHGASKEDFITYFNFKVQYPFDATDLAVINSAFLSGEKEKKSPRDGISFYVRKFIATVNLQLSLSGLLKTDGASVKKESLINQIFEKALKEGITKNNKTTIQAILANWEDEEKKRLLQGVREKLRFDSSESYLGAEEFVEALTGVKDPKTLAVIKHFIWQVKRKLFGKSVAWHMMPVLYGKSGSGKTQAIRSLLSPIQDLSLETDFESASDTRCDHNFEVYFVFFIDELARTARADFAAIKRKMTSEVVEYRILGLNSNNRIQNNVTWIGTSNVPINDVIKDCTSVRRFYQIETLDKCDWDQINSIDYLKLWKSVDENEDTPPIQGILAELTQEQEKFRYQDVIESWAQDQNLIPVAGGDVQTVPSESLVKDFKEWCQKLGINAPYTPQFIGRRLGAILGQNSIPTKGKRTYKVSSLYETSKEVNSTDSTTY